MDLPIVSIVMPAYNAEQYIGEAIKSVQAQTFKEWELIIVDDGSIDATRQVVEIFSKEDERVRFHHQKNGGQGKARNTAISKRRGTYLAFLDADDVWLPDKLEIQLQQIRDKEVDLVFSDCLLFVRDISSPIAPLKPTLGFFKGEKGIRMFLEVNRIPILTVLMKADAIIEVGGFTVEREIQNAEDYHLWLKLLFSGKSFFGSETVSAGYRVHPNSATSADKAAISKAIEALVDLRNSFSDYSKLINSYLKERFKMYHYSSDTWDKNSYCLLIKKNCLYLGKKNYNLFLQITFKAFGFKVTRKVINKCVNG